MILFLFIYTIFYNCIVIFGEKFPTFVWTNERESFPQVLAGHTISSKDFKDNYLQNHDNIIVFLRNYLNIGDFISSGSVYSCETDTAYYNLKNVMLKYHSTYLPYVDEPVALVNNFPPLYKRHVLESVNVNAINEKMFEGKNVIFLKFDDAKESSVDMDKVIGKITKTLEEMKVKFLALYTSSKLPKMAMNVINKPVAKRHLLSLENNQTNETGFVISDTTFLMRLVQLKIGSGNTSAVDLSNANVTSNDCVAQNKSSESYNCTIQVYIGDANEAIKKLSFEFFFATSRKPENGFWYIKKFFLSYTNNSQDMRAEMDSRFVAMTPLGYSYHCSKQPPVFSIDVANSTNYFSAPLVFTELQIQVFMANHTEFGHYNDCVGFFTIPIWMFIISAFVLLSILYLGISMLMSITTMDRYDDPKGKTLAVTAGD